jgi:hypothetical protein
MYCSQMSIWRSTVGDAPGAISQSKPALRQSMVWKVATVSSPRFTIRRRSSGDASKKKPASVYGGLSVMTSPFTKSIAKKGCPRIEASAS